MEPCCKTHHSPCRAEAPAAPVTGHAGPKVVIVGSPNVGKSLLFNRLTGRYVTVSNYPGTSVEVARGRLECGGRHFQVVDTPGMYTLLPINEEERVARRVLLEERAALVLHVAEAKNLERSLPLTMALAGTGLPVMLVLNVMDEAEKQGVFIDVAALEKELGVPVVPTVATSRRGVDALKTRIAEHAAR